MASGPRVRRSGPLEWAREHLLAFVALLIFVFLLAPNVVMLVMSFNQPDGKYNYVWHQFSLNAWAHPCAVGGMCASLGLSLEIGVVATIGATILGTMVAFAVVRHRFRARSAINVLLFLPMAAPEVVMGATLLTLFFNVVGPGSLGFWTITIAHVMFSLSYVVVTVKSRLAGMDPTLEKAAADLYATPRQTFLKVTLPLVAPGIAAAALLAFALSIDDYIITVLTAGTAETFPMFVWGSVQRAVPPQIDVIGSMILLITMAGVAVSLGLGRFRTSRQRG
jgi:spermidine/putrescine transport system permease protein